MALENRGGDESLLTQVTFVLLVSVVHHLDVHVERVFPLEGGVTLATLECPLTFRNDKRPTEHSKERATFCHSFLHPLIFWGE